MTTVTHFTSNAYPHSPTSEILTAPSRSKSAVSFRHPSRMGAWRDRTRARITGILHFLLSQPSQKAIVYFFFSYKNQGVISKRCRRFRMKSPTSFELSPRVFQNSPSIYSIFFSHSSPFSSPQDLKI